MHPFPALSSPVACVAVSRDGRTALSGCGRTDEVINKDDFTLKLWDIPNRAGIRTFTGHVDRVTSVAFSPDGRTALSGSWDMSLGGEVKLWDLLTGNALRGFAGHTNRVYSVAFLPDGRTALSASGDKTLKLWDLASGNDLRTFVGHTDRVYALACSSDGLTVVSGSRDKELKIWDFGRVDKYRDFQPKVDAAQHSLQANPQDPFAMAILGEWYAFRGVNNLAVEFLEQARAGGLNVNPVKIAQCYWELSDDLPAKSKLTRPICLQAAAREFNAALAASNDPQEQFNLQLCLSAVLAEEAGASFSVPLPTSHASP
jgi:predicted NACHT family NTPase